MSFNNVDKLSENVSITLDSIDFQNSTHQIKLLDMYIINSKLINYILKFGQKYGNSSGNMRKFFSISKSVLGNWNNHNTSIEIYCAQAEFLHVNNSNYGQANHFRSMDTDGLDIWRGDHEVKEINNDGTSILLYNSSANLSHVNVSDAKQVVPILNVRQKSDISLNNCAFEWNFVNTKTLIESIIKVHESKLTVSRCTFLGNQGKKGGVIEATGNSTTLHISDSNFTKNLAFWSGGVLHTAHVKQVDITSSNFVKNSAHDHGGVIISTNTETINITHSNFIKKHSKNEQRWSSVHGK